MFKFLRCLLFSVVLLGQGNTISTNELIIKGASTQGGVRGICKCSRLWAGN